MSHIDTLKIYDQLMAANIPSEQARAQVLAMEQIHVSINEAALQWLKEAKNDFASNKLVSILGGLILLVGAGIVGQLWHISVKVERIDAELQQVQNVMTKHYN